MAHALIAAARSRSRSSTRAPSPVAAGMPVHVWPTHGRAPLAAACDNDETTALALIDIMAADARTWPRSRGTCTISPRTATHDRVVFRALRNNRGTSPATAYTILQMLAAPTDGSRGSYTAKRVAALVAAVTNARDPSQLPWELLMECTLWDFARGRRPRARRLTPSSTTPLSRSALALAT